MEAPKVTEPSTVISGKLKILKLINTPSASSARINPIVNEPMSKVIFLKLSCYNFFYFANPASAVKKFAFAGSNGFPLIVDQVHDLVEMLIFENVLNGFLKVEATFFEQAEIENRGMKMTGSSAVFMQRPAKL